MKTHLAPKARHESTKGETMLMEANHEHSSIFVPRTIQWKDVLSNNDWRFENITPPFASHSERSQIERVIQFPDGSIELKFLDNHARRSSSNRRSSWSPSTSGPSKPVPRPPSSSKTPEEATDDEIISNIQDLLFNSKGKVTGVDFSGDIPKIFYQDIPGSPTASEMEPPKEKPSWLGMLKVNKPFEPDLDILQEQWTHPDNQVKRKWYVSSYTLKQRESFRDLWMKDMRRIGCEIEFFRWFEMTGRIENCTESLQVIINKWYTSSNKIVESITPPLEGINIPIAGTVIKASPFKEKSDKADGPLTSADIDRVVEQNNYSNQILHTISRQIEDTKPNLSGRPTPASTSSSHNIETYPGFKIPEFSKEKFPKLSDTFEVTGNIIEKINAQLNNFNISVKEDKTSKKVSTLHKEPNSKAQEKSNLLQKLASSRFHNMKNYHDKPSFPDLQYEENAFLSTSSHEGRSITKWNIDGLAEHQVYNKLHEMGVAITAYKLRGSADRDAANMIIAGFTGMLKHWWDNYCTDEIKQLIITATATETVVKMEGTVQSTSSVTKEDACATLLYHIAKHFIGEPKLFQDRSLQILSNLSCPNLDKFIHYKHAFLSKVMIRPDCNLDFWKERFISGLPPLFADKVRTKIQDRNNGNIPYGNLTYGDLVSTINIVALELCTDIKLKHQLKKEQSSSRKELGSFCRDFGFITPPDKIKNDKKEKPHRKKSRRREDSTRPKRKKSRSKRPNDAKVDVCWTCGKTGASDEYSDDEDINLDYDSDANNHSEPSISDLRHEVSSLKEEIRNIKTRLCTVETDILTSQVPKRTAFHDLESNQGSSHEDLDDNTGIDLSNVNNDHLLEPLVTNTGNDTSTSAAPGVTVISSIRPQSYHIPVKIVVSKHFVINKIALLDSGADRNCIVKGIVPTKAIEFSSKFPDEIPDKTQLQRENMRPFRPNTPSKEGNDLLRAKMARPFAPPPLTPAKTEPFVRPVLTFQNKFTALADFPRLPSPTQAKLPKLICPPQPKMINLRPMRPTIQEASSSSVQTKASYAMKTPESFAQAVNPELTKTIPTKPIPKEETFEFTISQILPLMALNKEPQTYNWYDYKAAWMNFLYLRPRHTWFVKYSSNITKATIPRWFYEWWNLFGGIEKILPQQFLNRYEEFQTKEEITTLPEHIKLCKYFIQKRISYIISWNFSKDTIERIQYLCKQVQVKGWVPKQPNVKAKDKAGPSPKKLSKAALKQKLKEAMDNIDKYDEVQIMKMIEDAASTESSSEDNGDMRNPKGLALAYMEPNYE
ncbi:hypothetical protein KY290_031040 [Solanum tuberosum]|uniref:Polyprotein n=1 Tax=Solanum tuberosum TaxID=4113 RepID=A0ABQ7U808_SOLTU|nr:hypothetical protein KY290_031040 [Solanum tuberosum]